MTANMLTCQNDAGSCHAHTTQYIENLILVVILTLQSNLEWRANTVAWWHVAHLNRASDRSWKKVKFCIIFRDKCAEKSAHFVGIFEVNFARNQSVLHLSDQGF